MEIEHRYIVIKKSDLATIPKKLLDANLEPLLAEVNAFRKQHGKPPLECLVIEKDWPEYQPALDMLSARVDGKRALWGSIPESFLNYAAENYGKQFVYRLAFAFDALGVMHIAHDSLEDPAEGATLEGTSAAAPEQPVVKHSHYKKDVRHLAFIDVYRVLDLFGVTNPAIQHAVKKLLVPGKRGAGKTLEQDLKEARDSIDRALAMLAEDEGKQP